MQICVPTQLLALLFCELNIAITSPTFMPKSESIFDWLREENLASKHTASSKSISFSCPLLSNVIFEGFRSRWATLLPFRQASTSASSKRMYLMSLTLTSGRLSITLRILSRLPLLQGSKRRQMVASSGLRMQLTNWMTPRWCKACRMKMDLTNMRYLPRFSIWCRLQRFNAYSLPEYPQRYAFIDCESGTPCRTTLLRALAPTRSIPSAPTPCPATITPLPTSLLSSQHPKAQCNRYHMYNSLTRAENGLVGVVQYNSNDNMRKLSLTFPDQIIEEMSLLCLNKPKVCKKESKLGWTSNDRIIHVQDSFLQYYNLHPGFVEHDPASLKRKHFKAAVRLDFIHEVNFLPRNKIKKTFLEIVFPEKKMVVKASDQAKAVGEEEEQARGAQQKLEKWLFEFPFDVKEFIESKREEERNLKRILAKIVPLSPKEIKELAKEMPTTATPKSRPLEDKHELNIQEYVETIQKTKNLLKTKAEMAEEQRMRQRKKKEKEMAEIVNAKNQDVQESFAISAFWREYYKYYEQIIKLDPRAARPEKIQRQLALLKEIDFFNSSAKRIAESYIDEYVCGFGEGTREFNGWRHYKGLWLKTGGKELNQQFMVNYNINDILFTLREVRGYKVRLPLMTFIEHKGVKVLIMCDMPFSELEKTEVYNLRSSDGDLQLMGRLKEALQLIEDVMNVKSEPFEVQAKRKVLAPLGHTLKIFEYNYKKDKTQDQIILPNFYYLINPGIVFPIDYNFQKNTLNSLARLRPEIVAFYRDYCKEQSCQLLSQAFMISSATEQFKRAEDGKVKEASKLIQNYWIPMLVDKLNSLEILFVDSYSIKTTMQEMGINVRYLHRIHEKTTLPYVREMVLAEVLARTIKKEFRQALADLIEVSSEAKKYARNSKEYLTLLGEKKAEGQKRYKSFALDYLNLVFGDTEQTRQFWKIIIFKCAEYFRVSTVFPPPVKPGCLLNAVLWHCGISIPFTAAVPLFHSPTPFHEESEIQFEMRLKTFDFPSFQIQKLFRSVPTLEEKIDLELFREVTPRLLKMELLFASTLGWETNTVLAKLNNYRQYLQRPGVKNQLHPMLIPYYIANKSPYNFDTGIKIINFALPQTHPLLVVFHLQYIPIFEQQLMRKTVMLLAIKSFGEFHPKTSELYSRFYHEGEQDYYLKAQRLKNIEACSAICDEFYQENKYESCLAYCLEQIAKLKNKESEHKLGTGNYRLYIDMLMQGLDSAVRTIELEKGILISKEISDTASSFKYSELNFTEQLFRQTLLIHLMRSNKKYFLYKMVMFVIHIRMQHQTVPKDKEGLSLPSAGPQREKILQGLTTEYFPYGNHSNWIEFILATMVKSFQYFNFLEDLFNGYAHHLRRYNSDEFRDCLGYLDLLVRLYGQKLFKEILYDVRFN